MYSEKMFMPVRFRLPFHTDREAPQVGRCDDSKKYSSRQPLAASSYRPRGFPSDPLRRLEKVQLQIAFGFGVKPRKKSLQPSEMYPEKTFTPDGLRLWVDPLRKALPAFGNVPQPFASGFRL